MCSWQNLCVVQAILIRCSNQLCFLHLFSIRQHQLVFKRPYAHWSRLTRAGHVVRFEKIRLDMIKLTKKRSDKIRSIQRRLD